MSDRFFIMVCSNGTEQECLDRKLFGDKQDKLADLRTGDQGFLLNLDSGDLLGLFEALSERQINIDPDAWGGKFPIQVRVRLSGPLSRLREGREILRGLGLIRPDRKAPSYQVFGDPVMLRNLVARFPSRAARGGQSVAQGTNQTAPTRVIGVFAGSRFEKVVGLDDVKSFIVERMVEPLLNPELAASYGLRVGGGILLYGPPGTGKTLLAKATAAELDARFEELSPSVIRGWPGEPEARVERLFSELRGSPRAVLFLDEAEALLARRDDQRSSVMERMTTVLLTQLSKISIGGASPFFVIAATNAPWDIDDAFLRPGRLDRHFYVGPPDEAARLALLRLHLGGRPVTADLEQNVVLKQLSGRLSGYTGADIEQIIERAAAEAYRQALVHGGTPPLSIGLVEEAMKAWPRSVTDDMERRHRHWGTSRS